MARRTPRGLSVTTECTSGSTRLSTTVGTCLAIIRIAESLIRLLDRTMPSTEPRARSTAIRSARLDSCVSQSMRA